jgi:hypothetical protein
MYYGRVLLSMSVSPSEKPKLEITTLGAYREPPIMRYALRVDAYSVETSYDLGDRI